MSARSLTFVAVEPSNCLEYDELRAGRDAESHSAKLRRLPRQTVDCEREGSTVRASSTQRQDVYRNAIPYEPFVVAGRPVIADRPESALCLSLLSARHGQVDVLGASPERREHRGLVRRRR